MCNRNRAIYYVPSSSDFTSFSFSYPFSITASGKTFTVQGTKSQPGLIPRIVADLFGRVLGDCGEDGKPKFKVVCRSEQHSTKHGETII